MFPFVLIGLKLSETESVGLLVVCLIFLGLIALLTSWANINIIVKYCVMSNEKVMMYAIILNRAERLYDQMEKLKNDDYIKIDDVKKDGVLVPDPTMYAKQQAKVNDESLNSAGDSKL